MTDKQLPIGAELPKADWTQSADLAALVAALGEGNMRWVGGAVRDTLLGVEVADVDAATTLAPDEVIRLCAAAQIRTVPTGIDHGTITAVLDNSTVEITTLRRDVSTDGRRATIAFAKDWREDAARRDFTINALYVDPVSLEIFDYFNGLEDLADRRIRFIGEPQARIREDHLRILRYYRFHARFGGEYDPLSDNACADLAPMLKGISRERIAMELLGLLALPDPADTIAHMYARAVLPVILPETGEAQIAALRQLVAQEQAQHPQVAPDPLRRLAALIPADEDIAHKLAIRLRLSKAQRKSLVCMAQRNDTDSAEPYALAYREGIECARNRLLLAGTDIGPLDQWQVPQFPLKGGEIVGKGVQAGPQVARILQEVEQRWIAAGFPDRAAVLALVDYALRGKGQRPIYRPNCPATGSLKSLDRTIRVEPEIEIIIDRTHQLILLIFKEVISARDFFVMDGNMLLGAQFLHQLLHRAGLDHRIRSTLNKDAAGRAWCQKAEIIHIGRRRNRDKAANFGPPHQQLHPDQRTKADPCDPCHLRFLVDRLDPIQRRCRIT